MSKIEKDLLSLPIEERKKKTSQEVLDFYFPERTPAKERSEKEDDEIQNFLQMYYEDFDPVLRSLSYDDCETDPPAYTGTGTETGRYIEIPILTSPEDGYFYTSGIGFFMDTANEIRIGKTVIGDLDVNYYSWMTFNDLPMSSGARINKALLSVTAYPGIDPQEGQFAVMITGHCGPSVTPENLTEAFALVYCNTEVQWDVAGDWTPDTRYETPDIATVIHDIINQPGWDSGDDLSIYINELASPFSDSWRQIYSYDGGADDDYEPILKIWYNEIYNIEAESAGVVCGGSARVTSNYNPSVSGGIVCNGSADPAIIMEGGVLCGGSALYGKVYVESTSGGALVNGSTLASVIMGMSGGAVCGGTSLPGGRSTYIVESAGVICGSAAFLNGYHKRKVVTIPANRDVSNFLMIVRAEISTEDIRVEDSLSNLVYHDLRSITETEVVIAFKVNVSSVEDSIYYIYHREV